jgi:multicomponent Na+:H+ antiporter subunit E
MNFLRKIPQVICFVMFYLREMVLASIRVAHDVLTPTHYMRPALLAIPLDAKTDFEILLLANMITMTPGSVSLDVSTDRSVLFVHIMYVDSPEKIRKEIKEQVERRVLELLR